MIIKKIKVKELYGYLDKEIDFFNDENYLIGINGSGKSSIIKILEAFFLKQDEYFKKLEFKKIQIETSETKYQLDKNQEMSSGEIWPLFISEEKINNKMKEEKIKELELKLFLEEEKDELLKEIETVRESRYGYKSLNIPVNEIGEVISINTKTPNLDVNIFENFLKKDNAENMDNIENVLLEINPVRNLNKILNETGKKNLQYCRAIDELNKTRVFLNEKNQKNELDEEQIELAKLELEIEYKVKNNKVTPERIQEFLDVMNGFLIDSHKRLEYDRLEGSFSLYILSKKLEKTKRVGNYSFLSSGERNLFSLITKVYFTIEDSSILLIDEPEESLHIAWQQKIISAIKKAIKGKNIQTIIATHAPNLTGKMINPEKLISIYPYNSEEK